MIFETVKRLIDEIRCREVDRRNRLELRGKTKSGKRMRKKKKERKNKREDYRLKFTHENCKDGCWGKGRAAVWLAVRQSGARSFCSNVDKQARETRLSLRLMEAHCVYRTHRR